MSDRLVKLKIEVVVNKLLFEKNIIEKSLYEETLRKLDRLMFEEQKNNVVQH